MKIRKDEKKMKKENVKTLRIIAAIVTVILGYGAILLCNYVKARLTSGLSINYYLDSFLNEVVSSIVVVVIVMIAHKTVAFRFNAKDFFRGFRYGLVPIAISVLLLLGSLGGLAGQELIRGWEIILVLAKCILIGFTEEALYRGTVQELLTDAFGDDTKKAQISAIVGSSVLFGATHLINAFSPRVSFTTALIQAVTAGFMGLLFGGIYLNAGRSIWPGVLIHAIIDAVSFISMGMFTGVTEEGAIGNLSPATLVNCVLYLVLFLYTMKYHETEDDEESIKKRKKLALIVAGGVLIFILFIFVVIPLILSTMMQVG